MSYRVTKRKRLDWPVEAVLSEKEHAGGGVSIGISVGDEEWLRKEFADLPPATQINPAWQEQRRKIHEARERKWHKARLNRVSKRTER